MAKDGYENFTFIWRGRTIEVAYRANWLNSGYWHLELRSADAVPVTQTGYRSTFVPTDVIEDAFAIEDYIFAWLDKAAEDPMWRLRDEDSRQLKLF